MHTHASQHGLTLLAEQSVYAQLVIERRRPTVTPQQTRNDAFYKTYLSKDATTGVPVDDYSITNLPNTILTLPANSIFDRILFITNDSPDFRLIRVDGNNVSQSNNCVAQSTSTFDPSQRMELTNSLLGNVTNKQPLFADVVPSKPDAASVANADACDSAKATSERRTYASVFGNPSTIQSSEISANMLSTIRSIVETTSVEPNEQYEDIDGMNAILERMKIANGTTVLAQLSEGNAPANYDTVRVGILLNVQRQLGNAFVLDARTASRVADAISEYVRVKMQRG